MNKKEKIPGVVEFLCQKESHQSVSLVLGSTGTRVTCLRFLNFFVFFLVFFFDFFWEGAIQHSMELMKTLRSSVKTEERRRKEK